MLNNVNMRAPLRTNRFFAPDLGSSGGAASRPVDRAKLAAMEAVRLQRPVKMTQDLKNFIPLVLELPELKASNVTAEQLAKCVIRTNSDGYYYNRGEAPFAVMLSGDFAGFLGVQERPLYYTVTVSGPMAVQNRIARESDDLASGMGEKNPLDENFLFGGKTFHYKNGKNHFTITCVYADRDLFLQDDVIAKGGARIVAENVEPQNLRREILDSVERYCKAFYDLGTLGRSRSEGPDLCPIDVGEVMEVMDRVGLQAEKDQGFQLVPFTTSGRPENGYFSHNEWRVTSYSVMESICALLDHEEILADFDIKRGKKIPIVMHGFGEVGSNCVRLVKELDKYREMGFFFRGISDHTGAFYRSKGFDTGMLYEIAQERDELLETGSTFSLSNSSMLSSFERFKVPGEDIVFMPSQILLLAGPGYVIKSIEDVDKLKSRIVAPAANNPLGTKLLTPAEIARIEMSMTARKIIYLLDRLINHGGIGTSKEEIVHRIEVGGLEKLKDPGRREWLREHVTEGDISDISWANVAWALDIWRQTGYSQPISLLMRERVKEINAERKYILQNWPKETSLYEDILRQDTAMMTAKMSVMGTDLAHMLPQYRALLNDTSAPDSKRRVAAYVLGKMARRENILPLLRIMDDPAESDIMFRNAAVGLGYTLEDKKPEGFYKAVIDRLKVIDQAMKEGSAPASFSRLVTMDWLLENVLKVLPESGK